MIHGLYLECNVCCDSTMHKHRPMLDSKAEGCNLHADSRPCAPHYQPSPGPQPHPPTAVFKSHFICRVRRPHLGQWGGWASHDFWQLHKQLVVQVEIQNGTWGTGNEIFPSHAIGGRTTTQHPGIPHLYSQRPTIILKRGGVTTASMTGSR